jgi:hypothetical protein
MGRGKVGRAGIEGPHRGRPCWDDAGGRDQGLSHLGYVERGWLRTVVGPQRVAGAPADQICALITPERVLSTPADEYELTAKYQVPEARLFRV